MKLKELKRTVNVCWSPAEHYPVTLATGSAAQQVDASFSSSSHLELYSLNLEDPGLDLELKSSLQTQQKFQKLVWSGTGVIVGGCDGGLLQFYSAEKLLQNATDPLLGSCTKHNGHISALDINPYQKNLLASGASESEIFIWDLNNTSQPMAPGTRNQPYDHVQGLSWNQQVQHILGSTFATRCVVWDLRKNEPIMKLSDSQSRTRWRSLAWHPSVATQLCIASEDDQVPVIQLWDLRLAASPLATLEGHQKGVLSLSWCQQDPDLMLSAGKDGRVLCWNPNNTKPGGEVVTEVSHQQQWVFDVSWCPRDPGVLVTASFDQQVTLHTLLGGSRSEGSTQHQSNIMESFGGVDSFLQLPAVTRAAAAPTTTHHQPPRAPRWLMRPCGARISFGGKLVTFEKCPQENGSQKLVYISQVVSDPEVVEQAAELYAALGSTLNQEPNAAETLAEYCRVKGDASLDQAERYNWFFLRANFLPTFRSEALNLLGFKQDEIPSKFKDLNADVGDIQTDIPALSRDPHTLIERKLSNLDISTEVNNIAIPNGEDNTSLICRALVCGNLEEAVELCLEAKRVADALIIASLASPELLYKVQKYHLKVTSGDPVTLVTGSLLHSGWDSLVRGAATKSWKHTLATLLTHCEGDALSHYCEMLGELVSQDPDPSVSEAATVCYLCAMSPERLVSRWAGSRTRGALTELVLLARSAAAVRGRAMESGGKLESVIEGYAWSLASQGCLQSALQALHGNRTSDLRDRLTHALGLATTQPNQTRVQQRARTTSGHSQNRGQFTTHNDIGNYTTHGPGQYDPSPWQQSTIPGPQPHHHRPIQPQPPPQPQPQPPRPGSVGPPTSGLPGRSKYKVDPSVQSAPLYNQYSFNSPAQYGAYNNPLPEQYNTFAPVNPSSTMPGVMNPPMGPMNPSNTSVNPLNPSLNPLNPPVNPLNPSLNPLNPAVNPLNPAVNPLNPPVNGYGYFNPQQTASEPVQAVPPKPVAPGWNDPPMLSSKPKPKQEAPAASQAPITHPLFGVEPPQHVPLVPGPAQYQGQQYPGQQYPGQQYPGQQYPGQQYPGQQYPEQQFQGQFPPTAPSTYQPQVSESPAPVEPLPVQKAPLPNEYVAMQNVFDTLRNECSERAYNAQMKRKLEDVQRRLETLYDMLREYRLSESAVSALQSAGELAQSKQYESAGAVVATLATGTDFATVATFLPALKVLFQLATQLHS